MISRERLGELRVILNLWDPIGVAEMAPDEYDCLHEPIIQFLGTGSGREELISFLREKLENHFGLDRSSAGIDETAGRLLAWWLDQDLQNAHEGDE